MARKETREMLPDDLKRAWQRLQLQSCEYDPHCQNVKSQANLIKGSQCAEALRSLLHEADFAFKTNRISEPCNLILTEYLLSKYAAVVDDFNGLDNFSSEALALASHKRNESQQWKSTLHTLRDEELLNMIPKENSSQNNNEEAFVKIFENSWNTSPEFKDEPDVGTEKKLPGSTVPSYFGQENTRTPSITKNSFSSQPFCNSGANPRLVTNLPSFQNKANLTCNQENNSKRKQSNDNNAEGKEFRFRTARDQLVIDQQKKFGNKMAVSSSSYGSCRKTLGARRGPTSKFVPPVPSLSNSSENALSSSGFGTSKSSSLPDSIEENDALKNVDPKMVELMMNEIMDHGPPISWDDIAGLDFAKQTIMEIVVWPMLRPDIFSGLRGPPKGLLLFGPPGTGKTLIGKCIACQSKATFFCISASSLTSKWVGEGEKLVRALFAVARCYQPSVIFIDEIDSLLTQRSESEHESSRRIKTEFLVQLDGAATNEEDRILIVGATNRPQELDEAARRRLVKRLYIPLPEVPARKEIVVKLMKDLSHSLSENDLEIIANETDGYSGADMANLCKEAALGPIRSFSFSDIQNITPDQVRPIILQDFIQALKQVRASVSCRDLEGYLEWNKKYGSGGV